jgi:hypothetical protein
MDSITGLERLKKKCSGGLMGNVFGETPNTAGEDARAPENPDDGAATVFTGLL